MVKKSGFNANTVFFLIGVLVLFLIVANLFWASSLQTAAGFSQPCDDPAQNGCNDINAPNETVVPDEYLPLIMRPIPTSTPTPTATPQAIIVNGNFESGHTGWTEESSNGYPLIWSNALLPVAPRSGSWAAWLGGVFDEDAVLSQPIIVPTSNSTLFFYFWIASSDVCGADYDTAGVTFRGNRVDSFDLCAPNNTNGWVLRTVNLSAYAGQSGTLAIYVNTDGTQNSNLYIDDVSLSSPLAGNQTDNASISPLSDEDLAKIMKDMFVAL